MIPLLGILGGIVAGALSVGSLWLITGMAARAARSIAEGEAPNEDRAVRDPRPAILATLRLMLAFLLKAPLLILIARGAQTLGIVGVYWCVGGVVLVYSLAVFWAAGRTHRP